LKLQWRKISVFWNTCSICGIWYRLVFTSILSWIYHMYGYIAGTIAFNWFTGRSIPAWVSWTKKLCHTNDALWIESSLMIGKRRVQKRQVYLSRRCRDVGESCRLWRHATRKILFVCSNKLSLGAKNSRPFSAWVRSEVGEGERYKDGQRIELNLLYVREYGFLRLQKELNWKLWIGIFNYLVYKQAK